MNFYGKKTNEYIICWKHIQRRLTYGYDIISIIYCKMIDKKHTVIDTTFGY